MDSDPAPSQKTGRSLGERATLAVMRVSHTFYVIVISRRVWL